MIFHQNLGESSENKWRYQIDKFVKENQVELSALAWGLWLANGNSLGTIGIDLQPQPHFVYCPGDAIEKLNEKVDNRLQELLGIIDNYQPEKEVVMVAIGQDQIKLIYFEPQISPTDSWEQQGQDLDSLLDLLEAKLSQEIHF
ncbi:beta-carboxysome assembly chaperone CcmS [Calothrix sp. 336/3]|uniref:beta-carboxysome assembly chaperone CcmS n=1 Tax=Calothrix sp. 336/3 TaxID=1337936 RepID=UPI0004E32771|nr:hypothetical protein [Calothrix sp. 336/3]AKG20285.1 hypothetical protein IJ00_02220 [Calothrix sp. 336/3]